MSDMAEPQPTISAAARRVRSIAQTMLRAACIFALTAGVIHSAHAATTIYGIRGTATAGANDIIRIDQTTGAFTVVYDNYPGGNAATLAQCPNGLLYYSIFGGTNQVYVFNPQTPTAAPAALGAGLPGSALRMACSPGGVLYYLDQADVLHIVSTATGAYTGAAVTITGLGLGGDIAFDSSGTLYGFSNTSNLFTIPLAGGAVTQVGTGAVTGLTGAGIGLAFDSTNAIRVLTNGGPGFYSVNTGTSPPSATAISTPPGGAATGDLASINVANPDLAITKTANLTSVPDSVATAVVYTIVVTNNSAYPVSGTVTDTFPAAVSAVTWTCAASAGSSCVASGAGNINTTAILAAAGTATYTVNATVTAAAPVINTASVALPFTFLSDSAPGNNTASNTISIRPGVSKAFGAASFGSNGNTSLTITISNANGVPITTSAVFTDTLPTAPGAMTINTAGNTGTCANVTAAAGSGSITMASGTAIPAGGCTIIVSVTASALGTYTNTIAAGALVTNVGSNASAASANVTVIPIIGKVFGPATIGSSGTSTLTITLANGTAGNYTGATFNDVFPTAPSAMTVAAPLTTSNTCGGTLQDSAGGALAAGDVGIRLTGGTVPANGTCVITVNVTATATGVYTNTIPAGAFTSSGGSNARAANATLTVASPSFTVAKTVLLVSDPVNGITLPKAIPGAVVSYSIQVTNSGAGTADNNTTLIVDPIPANTRLYVGDIGAPGSGPVVFVNGTPASGLTYTFISLASAADDVSFSNTGCSPFTSYTPVPDVNGFDAAVTCIRVNPKGVFAAASGGSNPNFEARFRVRVN